MRVARTAGSRHATSGYTRTIPELQVRDRALQVLLKLGTRFGLDPSSRAGLGVVADKSPNFVEEFLFKPRVIEWRLRSILARTHRCQSTSPLPLPARPS
jgi:hypothetical protein